MLITVLQAGVKGEAYGTARVCLSFWEITFMETKPPVVRPQMHWGVVQLHTDPSSSQTLKHLPVLIVCGLVEADDSQMH